MPSVFTLEGVPRAKGETLGHLNDGDDNALVQWLHTQSPAVAIGVGLGLSLTIGFVISQAAAWAFSKRGV
jgi:hypothetical protein